MPGRSSNEPANYIAVGKQTAFNVEATTFYFLKHLDGSMVDPDPEIQREREGGDGQQVGLSYRSQVKADPTLNANARPVWAAVALGGVLGAEPTTAVVATAPGQILVDHTLTPTVTLDYFTVDERSADEVSRVSNCKFDSVEITFEAGRPLRLDAKLMSGGTYYSRPIASAMTPARETGEPLFYPLASAVVTGASGAKVTKGKLTISRGMDGDIQTTGLNRADVVEQNQDYQLDLTVLYEDAALWRKAHYSGGSQVGLLLATIGFDLFAQQAAGSYQLRLVKPLLEVTGAKINKLAPDGKTLYLDIAAADIAGPTHACFAVARSGATTSYA